MKFKFKVTTQCVMEIDEDAFIEANNLDEATAMANAYASPIHAGTETLINTDKLRMAKVIFVSQPRIVSEGPVQTQKYRITVDRIEKRTRTYERIVDAASIEDARSISDDDIAEMNNYPNGEVSKEYKLSYADTYNGSGEMYYDEGEVMLAEDDK